MPGVSVSGQQAIVCAFMRLCVGNWWLVWHEPKNTLYNTGAQMGFEALSVKVAPLPVDTTWRKLGGSAGA